MPAWVEQQPMQDGAFNAARGKIEKTSLWRYEPNMPEPVKVTVFDDGPIEIQGPVTVYNEFGKVIATYDSEETLYLCRCGQSNDKPFCDGSHDDTGFCHKVRPKEG
jgi:CDGSH-type Zn-finger protein